MPFNPEDPKWTAYVLGELNAAELSEIEQELAESPEARQFVSDIRETTNLLEAELQTEPVFKLAAEQREVIEDQAKSVAPSIVQASHRRRKWALSLAAAATVLLAVGAMLLPSVKRAREVASRAKTEIQSRNLGLAIQNQHDASQPDSSIADSERLPSPYYLKDDVQYYPPGSEFKLSEEGRKSIPNAGYTIAKPTYEKKSRDLGYTVSKPVYEAREQKSVRGLSTLPMFSQTGNVEDFDLLGKDAAKRQKQIMAVTPRIIIAEEEEERLAISTEKGRTNFGFQPNDPLGGRGRWGDTHLGYRWQSDEDQLLTREAYDTVTYNAFLPARENPLSTFSIDVDTASYSNIRRFLTQNNSLPPKAAVRLEEMLNYFHYDYPQPEGDVPFSATTEVAGCPWNIQHRLVRIGLKGREIAPKKRPASNLVFLLDVSGSMSDANKLPLVREAMKLLVEQLTENDRVAIVVYAGESGLVLDATTGDKQRIIREAIDQLSPGGSTNGAGGIQLAYEIAARNFIKGGTNRVLLATDGDFNVGITDREQLNTLITEQAKSGVFLTTLGFGMGNLKDGTLEQLADKGNGNYAYIDDMREAKKVFVDQMNGTLITIAKDVKIQIECNPAEVASYRLIGYENRVMAAEDFNNDKKDAGEIGAGHTVTALYEIVPAGQANAEDARPAVDPLKYQNQTAEPAAKPAGIKNGELLTLKLRYKQPDGDTSKLLEFALTDAGQPYGKASADFKFASSVALFGMILQDSPYKGTGTLDAAAELAGEGLSNDDADKHRAELLQLIQQAKKLGGNRKR